MKYRLGALLALGVFWFPVFNACFFWDDRKLVLDNSHLNSLSEIFLHDLTWTAQTGGGTPFYRPLMLLSLAIDQKLWPGWAPGYHVWGLLLHLIASYFILRLGESRAGPGGGLIAAGFFALHPIQTEAVAWVSARNDPLSAVGIFGALWALEQGFFWRGMLFAALGMFSKETAVLLPIFWAGWCFGGGKRPGMREVLGLLGVVGLFLGARGLAGVNAPAAVEQSLLMAQSRWFLVPVTMLSWLCWPVPTSTASLYQPLPGPIVPMLCSLVGLFWLVRQSPRKTGSLVALSGIAVLPAVGAALATTLIGERYIYVPMGFLGIALGGELTKFWSPRVRIMLSSFGVLMGVLVGLQLLLWREERELVEAAYRRRPDPYSAFRVGHVRHLEKDAKGAFSAMYAAASGDPPFLGACTPAVGMLRDIGAEEQARKLAEELKPACSTREDFRAMTADFSSSEPTPVP